MPGELSLVAKVTASSNIALEIYSTQVDSFNKASKVKAWSSVLFRQLFRQRERSKWKCIQQARRILLGNSKFS